MTEPPTVFSPPGSAQDHVLWIEAPRGFGTAWVLVLFLIIGLITDAAIGTTASRVLIWFAASVIVVGSDVLGTRVARARRSLIVTTAQLSIAGDVLKRAAIVGLGEQATTNHRVLGRLTGEGSPRGFADVPVLLVDDTTILVPTHKPDKLIDLLNIRPRVNHVVRLAQLAERDLVDEIEVRAYSLFAVAGYHLPEAASHCDDAFTELVVLVVGDPVIGVARVRLVDTRAHLSSLAVLPGEMGHGVGSALLSAATGWAASQGYRAMTLIAFTDVAWNAPFFAARGFVRAGKLSPGLDLIRDSERAAGLDEVGPRSVMVRMLAEPAAEPVAE